MTIYRIKDWDTLFENAQSRKVGKCSWVAIPNKHDGEGYSRIMDHPKAAEIFSAWILMLQVASKCEPRGSLTRSDGSAMGADSLAIKTRGKREWFETALEVLSSPEIGWLECVKDEQNSVISEETNNSGIRVVTDSQYDTNSSRLAVLEQNGTEGKGIEENGIEERGRVPARTLTQPAAANTVSRPRFVKPTLDEVKLQCTEIGLPESEAEKFFSYYESNGWKVGRNAMKSWHAALIHWRGNWLERNPGMKPRTDADYKGDF